MQTVSFMKEVFANADRKVSLVILNQKQFRPAMDYTIKEFLSDINSSLIYVSLTESTESVLQLAPESMKKHLFVVDGVSGKPKKERSGPNTECIDSPANLTGMQIGIERAMEILPGRKVVVIDSLGALAAYTPKREFGKFLYLFTNKMKLDDKTLLLISTNDSIDASTLDLAKQFSDKIYDFSSLYVSSIELMDLKGE
jgi:KaiC/GvpD/RAD55 family RecA-like ATPase